MSSPHIERAVPHTDGIALSASERDLARFLQILQRFRLLIIIVTIVGTLSAAIIAFLLPNEYTSTVNAVPPKRMQTGLESVLGGLGTALRDVGLTRLAPPRAGGSGYDFMVVLQSRSLLDSLIQRFNLVRIYEIDDAESPDSALQMARRELLDRYEVELEGAGNYRLTILDRDRYRAAAMANAAIEIANNIARDLERRESEVVLLQIQSRLENLLTRMNILADSLAAISGKSLMFAPLEQAQAAARSLAEVKSQLMAQEVILDVLHHRYGDDDPATRQQQNIVELLRQKLVQMESQPGFVGNFSLREAPRATYDYLRYYTDLETLMKLKSAMLPMLEEIRNSLTRFAPALYVVDPAIPALKKAKPMRSLIIGGAFISSLIMGIILAVALEQWRKLQQHFRSDSTAK